MVDAELSCLDALLLENQFPRGGVLASVNSASEAAHWLETHEYHPLLMLLRSACSPGPIPIAISPEESGFAVFCPRFGAPVVRTLAERLAKLSGFVVLLRRTSENPIPVLRAARRKTGARDEEETPVDPEPEMAGVYHTSAVDLKLQLGGNIVHNIKISSDLQTHIFEPSPRPRHELGSFVSSQIILHPHQAVFDRSYTNIGFLLHRRRSVLHTDFLEPNDGRVATPYRRWQSTSRWTNTETRLVEKEFTSHNMLTWNRTAAPGEVRVAFGLALRLSHNEDFKTSGWPRISLLLRNQTFLWVRDPALPSRVRGVLVSTSTYVPDALTEKRLLAQGAANVGHLGQSSKADIHSAQSSPRRLQAPADSKIQEPEPPMPCV
ncbi:hypothetical protein FB45DRAFT_1070179 [Roridomyces roridus]|uniref:Uncharacterized protein n=1 Tax=Roridomyces roridus TaxID=1738132 RepID=A0AAD7F964_9AGAR|nr:hypothetical protein FB45DRAFT_1070179 [Roridomyces roridus]